MRIDNFSSTTEDSRARASATVTWEDSNRPAQELYMETSAQLVDNMSPNPNAFLLAAIMPALFRQERRIHIDGKICPQLRNGLLTAMLQIQKFYKKKTFHPLQIETSLGFEPSLPRHPHRVGSFLSGGVDSLATLHCNLLDFPNNHPGAIQDGIIVYGFGMGGPDATKDLQKRHERLTASLSELANSTGITLVPVYTNLRQLEDEGVFFSVESCGTALAAIAHQLSERISTAHIAASASISDHGQVASHPLLDPSYASSSELHIRYDGARLERLEKVRLIANWKTAIHNLRVCNDPFLSEKDQNCGHCAKCILTMAELLICGKLNESTAFHLDDLSPEIINSLRVKPPQNQTLTRQAALTASAQVINESDIHSWKELVTPLHTLKRDDLANSIENKLREWEKYSKHVSRNIWKAKIRRFDAKYLNHKLANLYNLGGKKNEN